jgi:hypothetical protein
VIAKLYTDDVHQTDIDNLQGAAEGKWNELVFDLSKADLGDIFGFQGMVDKKRVNKILFFPAPGEAKSGVTYFGSLKME